MRLFERILHMVALLSFCVYLVRFGRIEAAVFMISASMSIGICLGESKVLYQLRRGVPSSTSKRDNKSDSERDSILF